MPAMKKLNLKFKIPFTATPKMKYINVKYQKNMWDLCASEKQRKI